MKKLVLYVLSAILVVLLLHRGVPRGNTSIATRPQQSVMVFESPRSKQEVTYVTVGRYMGQQGAGARGIASLQCFLMSLQKSLGLSFVLMEPYFTNGHFKGHVDRHSTAAIRFRDIFDIEYFNTISKETGRTEMVEHDDVQKSPSYTILIKFVANRKTNADVLWQSETANGIPECLEREKNSLFFTDSSQNTCIVQVVVLPINRDGREAKAVMIEDIRDSIFQNWSPQNVTLMISVWGGHYYMPLESGLTCLRERNSNITKLLFRPSKRLQEDAKRYEEMFLDNQHRLAIMMRVEHVIREYMEKDQPSKLTSCFNEVLNISYTLQGHVRLYPFVTMDIGQYGSQTFTRTNPENKKLSRKTFQALYHDKWSVEEWEESFVTATGGVKDAAYLAALQRTLASRADCLILVGGGNFQSLALADYLDYHNNSPKKPCIHLVCTSGGLLDSIMQNVNVKNVQ